MTGFHDQLTVKLPLQLRLNSLYFHKIVQQLCFFWESFLVQFDKITIAPPILHTSGICKNLRERKEFEHDLTKKHYAFSEKIL